MRKMKIKSEKFKEYKVPKRKQPIFKFFSKALFEPLFKLKLESEIEKLPDKAIIVSVHAAKNGPLAFSVSYPKFAVTWGHHAMLGSYKERFNYLRNVLYIQKMHKNKFIATLKALYEAVFSIYVYKGIKVIGTYTDMRLLTTVRNSVDVLNSNASVVIYPEDSSEGYFDELRSVFPGFSILSEIYYKKHGEDVPIIPAYISTSKKRLIIGKPRYLREMQLSGMDKTAISDTIRDDINDLYRSYILTDTPVSTTVPNSPVRTKDYYGES